MVTDLLLTIFLVLLNGFFVAAEFAIVKVRASQVEVKAKGGSYSGSIARHIVQNLDAYLSATQLGITLASLGLGWVGEAVVSDVIIKGISISGMVIEPATAHAIAFPIAFVLITVMHIVFGELAPKSMAIQLPLRTAFAIAIPLQLFYLIFRPFIWSLNSLANLILRSIGISAVKGHEAHSVEELQLILEQGKETGALEAAEHDLIQNVFDFNDRTVKNILVPRTKIAAVDAEISSKELMEKIAAEAYTRLPVYEGNMDNIIGFVHVKDVLIKVQAETQFTVRSIMRPVAFVPESKRISDLLKEMQHKHNPMMAIVLDEFGGTAGLVTMEDIVEELVGEIQDEYDEEKPIVEKIGELEFLLTAGAAIGDVNEFLPLALPESEQYDSVAGLMNRIFEKIPEVGEKLEYEGYEYTIVKKSSLRVESVKARLLS